MTRLTRDEVSQLELAHSSLQGFSASAAQSTAADAVAGAARLKASIVSGRRRLRAESMRGGLPWSEGRTEFVLVLSTCGTPCPKPFGETGRLTEADGSLRRRGGPAEIGKVTLAGGPRPASSSVISPSAGSSTAV